MLYKDSIISKGFPLVKKETRSSWDLLARKAVFTKFQNLTTGRLTVAEGNEVVHFGITTPDFPISSMIKVLDSRMYSEIVTKGLNGAAEAYVRGWWTCDDLTALIRIFIRNRQLADQLESGLSKFASSIFSLLHSMRRNTRQNSLRNITAHYDLGNEFFATFLDDTKMYSCGIFETDSSSLKEASTAKIDRICQKLELSPDDHVLEIGTGWGGFAIHAAKQYGCRITTTTISQKQYDYARKKVEAAGLNEKIQVIKMDYRDLTGQFDKLVSIEMIEAVGHHYYDHFFRQCNDLLHAEGRMLIQGIIIVDYLYEDAKKYADFIKTYIFPGSCIPSINILCDSAANSTDMRLFHLEDITPHYAKTLNHWRQRFMENVQQIRDQGFSEDFIRLWNFYFCYCEGGFLERQIGDVQMIFTKPLCRMDPILPALNTTP
ncbi:MULTISPECIES: class I SAM-dependent methyltransferase [unclassified Nitrospina]|uniref:class I SAM-dependent methyltransferase n=1 Tax=unclassified Nitrospina TaxID=2638683 RepID=UPI003F9814CD